MEIFLNKGQSRRLSLDWKAEVEASGEVRKTFTAEIPGQRSITLQGVQHFTCPC